MFGFLQRAFWSSHNRTKAPFSPQKLKQYKTNPQIQLCKFLFRLCIVLTPRQSIESISSYCIFRSKKNSHQLQSHFQLCLLLRRGTNFAKLLSRWKIFQVAHFAQKTWFRFRLKFFAQKRSLLSLGIKREASYRLWSRQRVFKRSVPVSPFWLDHKHSADGEKNSSLEVLYKAVEELPYSIVNNSFHFCQH